MNVLLSILISCRGGSRGRVQGVRTPPEMTCGFLIQLVFCKKKNTIWFIGVGVEQETSAPPPKKTATAAKTVLFKRLRSLINFVTSIPALLQCQM